MSILDDTSLFIAVVQQGGFSHAARHLGLSNGLVSRRIARLESDIGISLIKRTTRQIQLTPEGELFWHHAQRIQQELDSALNLIQSSSDKPKGTIRVSAPLYFGRHYLTPIIMNFLSDYGDIKIDLVLSNNQLDPVKEQLDLVIRGAGYLDKKMLKDSNMQMTLLLKENIDLYASHDYLIQHGEPTSIEQLESHMIVSYSVNRHQPNQEKWDYIYKKKSERILLKSNFNCNDIDSCINACIAGQGIGKFTDVNVKKALEKQQLVPILQHYDWGKYNLYALYPHQSSLPKRTRLFLEYIKPRIQDIMSK